MLALLLLVGAGEGSFDLADLFDLAKLPQPRPWKVRQFSSFDRSGGNDDAGHFLAVDGDRAVLARVEGSGIVLRIWSANPDGEEKAPALFRFADRGGARFEAPFGALFDGKVPPFAPPLATRSSGGSISYLPMGFRDGLEISAERAGRCYYHVETMSLPPGVEPRGWDPADPAFGSSLARIREMLDRSQRENPSPPPPGASIVGRAAIGYLSVDLSGKPLGLIDLHGAGTVEQLDLEFVLKEDRVHEEGLRASLRVFVDGAEHPAVDAPVALFFCPAFPSAQSPWHSGFWRIPFSNGPRVGFVGTRWPAGHVGTQVSCSSFWRIPFSDGLRVELVGTRWDAGHVVTRVSCRASVRVGDPGTPLRFHARYRHETTQVGRPFTILEETGRGHFVGVSMTMVGNDGIWFLEGDEEVWVDGEKVFNGTGTEDYFNCGWYFNRGPVQQPLHGCAWKEENRGEIGVYRFHIPDAIPFEKSFRMTIEHGGHNDYPGAGYAAVAYAYLDRAEGAEPFPLGESPLPLVDSPLPPGGLDAKALRERLLSGKASIANHEEGAVLRPFLDLESAGTREFASLRLEIPEAGIYRLDAVYRMKPDSPAAAGVALDDRALGIWKPAEEPVEWRSPPVDLDPGEHRLDLRELPASSGPTPKGAFGIRMLRARNLLEGEGHLPLDSELLKDGTAVEQEISWDPNRKGTSQLWFRNARVGSLFSLEIPFPRAGTYRIGGRFTQAPDYSTFRLFVDTEPLGEPWDGYAPRVRVAEASFGERRLDEGTHRFTFEVVGRSEKARSDWMIGLDRLFLERLGD